MKRSILAFVAAFVAWLLVVTVLNRGLRIGLEGYAAAEPQMSFTLTMMVARLVRDRVLTHPTEALRHRSFTYGD